jgi:hypothetical protein
MTSCPTTSAAGLVTRSPSARGPNIRTISADEAGRRLAPRKLTDLDASEIDKAIAFAKGYMTATGELDPSRAACSTAGCGGAG